MSTQKIRNSRSILVITLLFAGAVQVLAQTIPPATKELENKLIAVLNSDATRQEKSDALRQLGVVGTKDVIPVVAALLGDEELSHMARYALQPNPDPAVDRAFRDALGKLKGLQLAGVIHSIGVRGDTEAVRQLSRLLQNSDAQVAQAAAKALGSIGNTAAAKALRAALPKAHPANQLALCEGLFRCAEALAAEGQRDEAIEIYDELRDLDGPHQVRAGALRGAILIRRQKDGVALLQKNLRSDDYIMFSAAAQTALEMEGSKVTQVLTTELSRLPADNQILVIQTIGKRGDKAALPVLFAAAQSGEKSVRLAAIRALPEIGHALAVPVLVELLADDDLQISETAQEALAALPGKEADAAVMAMLNSSEAGRRLTAIELIGRRRMITSIPMLLETAHDVDAEVRPAAIKMVGELGEPSQLSVLLDLLMDLKRSQELAAAEQALTAVCRKADDPQSHADELIDRLDDAAPAQKSALLRILGVIGGTNALEAVRTEIGDRNAQVRAEAIRALCAWKTVDAAPDLLVLARQSPNLSHKTAALRGYISLVRDESLSTEKKLAMCKEAAAMIQRNQEKKLLLGVLATVPAAEALSMAMEHLDNPATRDEASFAAVAISEKIVQQKPGDVVPDQVANALQKVMRATDNKDVIRRARKILNKARVPTKRDPRKKAG